MEYWEENYLKMESEIYAIEEEIVGLSHRIERAEDNVFSLTCFGNLRHNDEFDYEGKSDEERIDIAKEIIAECTEEKMKLEKELYDQKEKFFKVSKAIIDSVHWFVYGCFNNNQILNQRQKDLFKDEADRKVGFVLGREI